MARLGSLDPPRRGMARPGAGCARRAPTRKRPVRTPSGPRPRSGASNGRVGRWWPGTSRSARRPPADRRTGHAGEVTAHGRCLERCRLGRARTGRADHHCRDGARAGSPRRGGGPAAPGCGGPAARRRRRTGRGLACRGRCCAWHPVGAAPSALPCVRACGFSTSTGPLSARPSCACTQRTHGARLAAARSPARSRGCRRGPGADLGGAVARGDTAAASGRDRPMTQR